MKLSGIVLIWTGWAISLVSFFVGGYLTRSRPAFASPDAGYIFPYHSHGHTVYVTEIESLVAGYGFFVGFFIILLGMILWSRARDRRGSHA